MSHTDSDPGSDPYSLVAYGGSHGHRDYFLNTHGPKSAVSAYRKQMPPTHARRCFPSDNPRKPKGVFIQRTPTEHCSDTPYVSVFLAYADWWDDEEDVDSTDSVWDDDSAWDDHEHGTDWGTTAESPHGALLPNTH